MHHVGPTIVRALSDHLQQESAPRRRRATTPATTPSTTQGVRGLGARLRRR